MTHESIEPTTVTLGKTVATLLLASTAWIDQLDISIRIGGGVLALIVGLLTIRKLHNEHKVASINRRLKEIELDEAIKRSLNGKP